jgi:hypothetical protein
MIYHFTKADLKTDSLKAKFVQLGENWEEMDFSFAELQGALDRIRDLPGVNWLDAAAEVNAVHDFIYGEMERRHERMGITPWSFPSYQEMEDRVTIASKGYLSAFQVLFAHRMGWELRQEIWFEIRESE